MKPKLKGILLFLVLLASLACTPKLGSGSGSYSATDSYSYEDRYREQLKKTNEQIEKFNKMLGQNYESNELMYQGALVIEQLNDRAQSVRQEVNSLREALPRITTVVELKSKMESLKSKIDDAITTIEKMENLYSKDMMEKLRKDSETTIRTEDRERARTLYRNHSILLSQVNGLRDLFLGTYNDLLEAANARLATIAGPTAPKLSVVTSESVANPMVSGLAQGGKITGVVRDSLTGKVVEGASVGFKRLPESRDYFYTTKTDRNGAYESAFIREGRYYVDITGTGYVKVGNQPVTVTKGAEQKENIGLSIPVGEGKFRVVMSWCKEKANAVKDVDSYLQIPGVDQPLSYRSKGANYHGAHLDLDNTNWEGPETVTIHDVKAGTYVYYVNNFNARDKAAALGNSDVRVRVFKGNELVGTYQVPLGDGLSFELFRIEDGVLKETKVYNNRLIQH